MGKLHFWLLPNLTAECGFFESFAPTYEYTVKKKEDSDDDQRRDSGSPSDEGVGEGGNSGRKSSDNGLKSGDDGRDEKPPRTNDSEDSGRESNEWVKVKKGDAEENKE